MELEYAGRGWPAGTTIAHGRTITGPGSGSPPPRAADGAARRGATGIGCSSDGVGHCRLLVARHAYVRCRIGHGLSRRGGTCGDVAQPLGQPRGFLDVRDGTELLFRA